MTKMTARNHFEQAIQYRVKAFIERPWVGSSGVYGHELPLSETYFLCNQMTELRQGHCAGFHHLVCLPDRLNW